MAPRTDVASGFDVAALVGQAATDPLTPYTETVLDARSFSGSVSYVMKATTQNVRWTVFGSNDSAFAAEVVVQAEATVVPGTPASYTSAPAPFSFYRVKLRTAVAGVVGTADINGI